ARSPLVRVRLPAPSTPSMTMSTRRAYPHRTLPICCGTPCDSRGGCPAARKLFAMMLSRLVTALCTGAGIGAAMFAASPLAHANQDPAANPPNCSAADLEGVRAGVSASTSAYLFTHPDLNDFITSL